MELRIKNLKQKYITLLFAVLVLLFSAAGCAGGAVQTEAPDTGTAEMPAAAPAETPGAAQTETAQTETAGIPLPEHTAGNRTYYEIFTGSFYDSDGDGIGDLNGITQKLDYLRDPGGSGESLNVQGVWLMPIHPSPTYHKYDVIDYYAIDPDYGTMEDFERLVEEAGKRGISIIIDLVLNHTSSQHPWFLAALEEIESGSEPRYRNYYNFSEEKINGNYYPTAGGLYYEAHFWDQMPDLNMDSRELREEIAGIARFWLGKGVAGFRLDAVMHVYGSTEKNIEFWTWFADMCREARDDVFLVGEVWSSEMTIMPYFETGLALFAFPFHGHDGIIAKALQSGDGGRLASELARYDEAMRAVNPDGVNCLFLSNHDTGRSAGFLVDTDKKKLAAAIYLLAPGSPFIYYGEEIGMTGSGIDENKRTAMYWSSADATGITGNPGNATNDRVPESGVIEQLADEGSLLSYYRKILALKAQHPGIYDSTAVQADTGNPAVCALRMGSVTVMHNLTDTAVSIQVPYGGAKLAGYLSPAGAQAELIGEMLTIPPYATVVLE